jgi:hypothetical protein
MVFELVSDHVFLSPHNSWNRRFLMKSTLLSRILTPMSALDRKTCFRLCLLPILGQKLHFIVFNFSMKDQPRCLPSRYAYGEIGLKKTTSAKNASLTLIPTVFQQHVCVKYMVRSIYCVISHHTLKATGVQRQLCAVWSTGLLSCTGVKRCTLHSKDDGSIPTGM